MMSPLKKKGLSNETNRLHFAASRVALFLFLPHFDVVCKLLLNRQTAK